MSLKEKIELEKTLSKYRSDINNILNNSKTSNRIGGTSPNRFLNDENSEPRRGKETASTVDYYCPKPARSSNQHNRSIFDVFKPSTYYSSKKTEDLDDDQDAAVSAYSRHLREVRGSANWRGLSGQTPSSSSKSSVVKDDY